MSTTSGLRCAALVNFLLVHPFAVPSLGSSHQNLLQRRRRGGRLRPLPLASAAACGQPTRGGACTRPGRRGDAYPLGRLPEGRSSRSWGRSPRTEAGDGGAQHCRFRMGGDWKRAERRVRVFSLVKRL
ncbi:hypothetical protein BHM03_00061163 [Ensete ventricosum]|nr:hypothetical protein BHM03_00061163 [Ensete ventricosum]